MSSHNYLMFIFQTKQNQFIFQTYQTKFNYTKPNSSTLNQTHPPYQSELNHTKPNSSIPNQIIPTQTKPDNSQPNLTNPNWLGMHSRTISSFCLLLAILFTRVILQNNHLINFLSPGIAERSSAIQKYNFWQNE